MSTVTAIPPYRNPEGLGAFEAGPLLKFDPIRIWTLLGPSRGFQNCLNNDHRTIVQFRSDPDSHFFLRGRIRIRIFQNGRIRVRIFRINIHPLSLLLERSSNIFSRLTSIKSFLIALFLSISLSLSGKVMEKSISLLKTKVSDPDILVGSGFEEKKIGSGSVFYKSWFRILL